VQSVPQLDRIVLKLGHVAAQAVFQSHFLSSFSVNSCPRDGGAGRLGQGVHARATVVPGG
jgi:hypothetical protein